MVGRNGFPMSVDASPFRVFLIFFPRLSLLSISFPLSARLSPANRDNPADNCFSDDEIEKRREITTRLDTQDSGNPSRSKRRRLA